MPNDKKTALLKRFHAVCGAKKLTDDQKRAIVESYGHTSSKNMNTRDIIDAIDKLTSGASGTQHAELDKWRKRVIAAVGAWLTQRKYANDITNIKAVACRAAQAKNFNAISLATLKRIYYEFKKKQTVADNVACMAPVTIQLHSFQLN